MFVLCCRAHDDLSPVHGSTPTPLPPRLCRYTNVYFNIIISRTICKWACARYLQTWSARENLLYVNLIRHLMRQKKKKIPQTVCFVHLLTGTRVNVLHAPLVCISNLNKWFNRVKTCKNRPCPFLLHIIM